MQLPRGRRELKRIRRLRRVRLLRGTVRVVELKQMGLARYLSLRLLNKPLRNVSRHDYYHRGNAKRTRGRLKVFTSVLRRETNRVTWRGEVASAE